jgi:D-3-phosphoglycerate dehydrogenase/(S)-sulfolactate dehydrogenase
MRRILLTEADQFPITDALVKLIAQEGFELKRINGYAQEDIREAGKDCFGILMYHGDINSDTLDCFKEMQIISRVGTGYEKIDVSEANRRGIVVTNVPGAFTDVLADHAMLLVLMYARQMPFLLRTRQAQHWPLPEEFPPTGDLGDQTLGIIGFGPSGQALAKRALAFGMTVKAWSRTRKPEIAQQLGVQEVDSGRLRGAGLDVVDPEPLPLSSPLWQHPKVELTFHTAAFTAAGGERCMRSAIEEIFRVGSGIAPLNEVKS